MIYDDPKPGDHVLIESVLGVVDRIQRADAKSPSMGQQP
jgi:hypothetical protein